MADFYRIVWPGFTLAITDVPFPAEEHIARLVESPDAVVLVADEAGRVIGFLQVRVVQVPDHLPIFVPRRYAFVDSMAVLPAFRRQGIGGRLLDAVETWAREQGVLEIELTVFEFNQAALHLYEAAAYSTVQRRMWKLLSG